MNSIFVSYANEDRDAVLAIYKSLKHEGFLPWIDIKNLLPGQDWEVEIDKAIRASDIFIACLSKSAVAKQGFVQSELKKAQKVLETIPEGKVFLIPVRLDACEVPSQLARLHWINYFEEEGPDSLVGTIKQHFATIAAADNEMKRPQLSFANIAIDKTDLNWKEVQTQARRSLFPIDSSQFFRLGKFVFDADLTVDVTLMNLTNSPLVLNAVGIETVSVAEISYAYGIPRAAKIYQSDAYEIELPNIKEKLLQLAGIKNNTLIDSIGPLDLRELVCTRLKDPVYLEAKAPYRYRLSITKYQKHMPNHAILRLWVSVHTGEVRSNTIETFTW